MSISINYYGYNRGRIGIYTDREREQMTLDFNVIESLILLDGLNEIVRQKKRRNEIDRNIANELIIKIHETVESELENGE